MAAASPPESGGPEHPARVFTVGIVGSAKKIKKFFEPMVEFANASEGGLALGMRCVLLSLEDAQKGTGGSRKYPAAWDTVDVLLHRLADDVAACQLDGVDWPAPVPPSLDRLPDGRTFHDPDEVEASRRILNAVAAWRRASPARRTVLEDLKSVLLASRRMLTYSTAQRCLSDIDSGTTGSVRLCLPWSCRVGFVAEENEIVEKALAEGFHLIVKSDAGSGKPATHVMAVIGAPSSTEDEEGDGPASLALSGSACPSSPRTIPAAPEDVVPEVPPPPFPRFLQRLVPDARTVIKAYCIGGALFFRVLGNRLPLEPVGFDSVTKRRWFSSVQAGLFPLLLDTVEIPAAVVAAAKTGTPFAALSSAALDGLEAVLGHPEALAVPGGGDGAGYSREEVVYALAVGAVRLRRGFGLELFGFDIVVGEDVSAGFADGAVEPAPSAQPVAVGAHVIDVNYFPGYGGVPDVFAHVLRTVRSAHERGLEGATGNQAPGDSATETDTPTSTSSA